jgi:hypothetical protein
VLGSKKTVKIAPAKIIYSVLVAEGTICLSLAIIFNLSIPAFIGLGLLFWGILFAYVRTEEYSKKVLLNATTFSLVETLNQAIEELGYNGPAVYMPPKYFRAPETLMLWVLKEKSGAMPTLGQMQGKEPMSFSKNPEGLLLTPPGAELLKLFEKTLETDFARADLQYLRENIPRLFIENLEIAESFYIETEKNNVFIKIGKSAFKVPKPSAGQEGNLGSPISSAIACVLAKTTGKLVVIKSQETSEDDHDVTLEYQIFEQEA